MGSQGEVDFWGRMENIYSIYEFLVLYFQKLKCLIIFTEKTYNFYFRTD